jgi:tetratricopeptide (TPR) repeat protein
MTMQPKFGQSKFASILPWLVGAAGLVFYLATLNPWISFDNLGGVARGAGWIWGAEVTSPVSWLVTRPLHWLPASLLPRALNVFSAVCAALTLVLLARSVTLLPHDRTHEQRQRETSEFSLLSGPLAWIPPLLAVLACGLQLTFWESATTGGAEMFDLLLLAYIIRCLLEFRVAQRDSWLFRAALVYAAAMTNNWVMIALLPAFVVAVLWIKGLSFFNLRFIGIMALFGGCGLLFYFLLPAFNAASGAPIGFFASLGRNLGSQKYLLIDFLVRHVPHDNPLLLASIWLGLISLCPLIMIGIRWSSYFGDPSPLGTLLTTWILHVVHAAFLLVCLWVTFDPKFSPRYFPISTPATALFGSFSFAAVYYLGALSVGYFAGYFLLVFQPLANRGRRSAGNDVLLGRVATGIIIVLLLLVPAGLLYKNVPEIRITNGSGMKQYAAALTRNLPDHAVVLCDSDDARSDAPRKLWLAQAWLAQSGQTNDRVFLDTIMLKLPAYHGIQQKLHPDFPKVADPNAREMVDDAVLLRMIGQLSEKRPLYYLHPSFGYYFEVFYPTPRGAVLEMQRYPTNTVSRPPLTSAELAENENFWKELGPSLDALAPYITQPSADPSKFHAWFIQKLHIPYEPNVTATVLGRYYSQLANAWGVQAERAGLLQEAGVHFQRALALNADNLAAKINLDFNQDLQSGHPIAMRPGSSLEDELGKYHDWQQVLRETGPMDEVTHRFIQGMAFAQGGLYRQAAQQFERIHELLPDNVPGMMWLAKLYAICRLPEKAVELTRKVRARTDHLADSGLNKLDLLQLEVTSLYAAGHVDEARQLLTEALDKNPQDPNVLAMVFQYATAIHAYPAALSALDHQLQLNPNDAGILVNKGFLFIQTTNYVAAIPPLTQALALDTNNDVALLDRAIAYLGSDKLDESERDYQDLLRRKPTAFQVYYGLGEIAWRKKNTNAAIQYFEGYLTNSPPNPDEIKTVEDRVKMLKSEK